MHFAFFKGEPEDPVDFRDPTSPPARGRLRIVSRFLMLDGAPTIARAVPLSHGPYEKPQENISWQGRPLYFCGATVQDAARGKLWQGKTLNSIGIAILRGCDWRDGGQDRKNGFVD